MTYGAYPPPSDSRALRIGIRSLNGFSNLVRPLAQSVLYLRYGTREASPKAISGRTSYLRVRLAFHSYPQLIQAVFNRHWFGLPRRVTVASPWPWVDHPVSGLIPATKRPIQTRFPYGSSALHALTLLLKLTRRSVLQKVRRHTVPCGTPCSD